MKLETNKTLVRHYFEAYDTQNINQVTNHVHPNHVHNPGNESLNYAARKRDDQVFFSAFSSIKTVTEDQIVEDDKVVTRVTMYCKHTGTYQNIAPMESPL